ncbi:universal stress protein [Spiribacter halobius]|uniref:Universal stress protein n=1 Tax=Sediminicurvatus halobius TaxID=2182432 RepID=A0A2U2MYM5_9GAMM|nr:universal stress protein [Spiribacter halobius]PWG61907.1 universal stress protein [Spiribacter halobius]UEX79217.1 universal stress protein [Spiribacter halobius]
MYNTIIVPIELTHSERIQPMLSAARTLASENARIVLVSVVEDMPGYVASQIPSGVLAHQEKEVRDRLETIAGETGFRTDVSVRTGKPAREIIAAAKENDADLIVIASHRPGFGDFLIGSTAADVVRHAPCSVHVVREIG